MLGNIRVTVSDKKFNTALSIAATSATSYLPFGMQEPNMFVSASGHRYGFNGMEKDNEIKGDANSLDFGSRIYDPRSGRWLSLDPLAHTSQSLSPYNFVANSPIVLIDPDGKKEKPYQKGKSKDVQIDVSTQTFIKTEVREVVKDGVLKKVDVPIYCPQNDIAFNCHSLAWHKSQGDRNPYDDKPERRNCAELPKWDNNPEDDIEAQNAVQLNKDVRNIVGDKVIYFVDKDGDGTWDPSEKIDHSALVKEIDNQGNTVTVEAKMGQDGMSINHPGAPGYYEVEIGEDKKPTGNKLTRAYLRTGANIQTLGDIKFDSNTITVGKDGVLIAQDILTGKDYGVTRDPKTGKYDFVRTTATEKGK